MDFIYIIIVAFLLILAIFDLYVGVSNDAVNFLSTAIGSRVASFRVVIIVAAIGVIVGSSMSTGMMDIARHGVMSPARFSFHEVIIVFLSVMVTDVLVLDKFNSLGLPTSTTVSLVFELLGAAFVLAVIKTWQNPAIELGSFLNSNKALNMIIAIFTSVAVAFIVGYVVQWITRIVFTFNKRKHSVLCVTLFSSIAFTSLTYFIITKGLFNSPIIPNVTSEWLASNTIKLTLMFFAGASLLSLLLLFFHIDVFRIITLYGTFALAMAFASNDLVNFIGVPLASLDALFDYLTNGNGDANTYKMTSLMASAKGSPYILLVAATIMVVAMMTSKKARGVVNTTNNLSRQDEGDEMFDSSRTARSIVRVAQNANEAIMQLLPQKTKEWIGTRFQKEENSLPDGVAFDMIRAATNLTLASILIVVGTVCKLPLSTTYVTFMVTMGTSLADRAWSRESAVFRTTGMLSVIGGWFITAGTAFIIAAIVCTIIHLLGFIAMISLMAIVVILLVKSNIYYAKKVEADKKDNLFTLMMRTKDPEITWDLLKRHVSKTQTFVCCFAKDRYARIIEGFVNERLSVLKSTQKELDNEQEILKRYRKKELLALKRISLSLILEKNTWYHLGVNSDRQYIYCLKRILEPTKEHISNNFNPLPQDRKKELQIVARNVNNMMQRAEKMLTTTQFEEYKPLLEEADILKNKLSAMRKREYDRLQTDSVTNLRILLVYINLLQETQEFLSVMRHQVRAAYKFYGT